MNIGPNPSPHSKASSATPVLVQQIVTLLGRYRYSWRDEYDLQDSITTVLTEAGLTVAREVVLTPGERLDLLVERVGIEVKVKGNVEKLARQLQRYAHSPHLDALIVATTRTEHRALPAHWAGLPLTVACLTHVV
jgi:hypothetical protein